MSLTRSSSSNFIVAAAVPTAVAVICLVAGTGVAPKVVAAAMMATVAALIIMGVRRVKGEFITPALRAEQLTGGSIKPTELASAEDARELLHDRLEVIDEQRTALLSYAETALLHSGADPDSTRLQQTPYAPVLNLLDQRAKRDDHRLSDVRGLLRGALETTEDFVAIVDSAGTIMQANARAESFGYGIGTNMHDHLVSWKNLTSQATKVERTVENGRIVITEMSATSVENQNATLHIVRWRDTEQPIRTQHAAPVHTDELTGLLNRPGLQEAYNEAAQAGAIIAVLHMDLEGFQTINHHHGYEQGDAILHEIAQRLQRSIPTAGTIARTSGDEFVAFFEIGDHDAAKIMKRLFARCSEPVVLNSGGRTSVNLRGGWSLGQAIAGDKQEQLRRATFALYESKAGSNRLNMYDAELGRRIERDRKTEIDLRTALAADQFVLYGQKIVDVLERRVEGIEMLLRWDHPDEGLRPPSDFLEVAENSGLLDDIDRWVFSQTCDRAKASNPQLNFSMNLSSCFISRPDAAQFIVSTLAESGLAAGRVQVDLKEADRPVDVEALVRTTKQLTERGVHVAIDDFGSGYSTLANLMRMNVSSIKIDRALTQKVNDPDGRGVIQAILSYAKQRGLRVVAEGVETEEESQQLQELGCRYQQGYFHHRPQPVGDAMATLGLPDVAPAVSAQVTVADPVTVS